MCGIAGIINFTPVEVNRELLACMNNAQRHRGPDDCGVGIYGNVGLAHRRLSIIDLSQGHQPMSNEDGTIHIVFNGEIYNWLELRHELEGKGHQFKTRTDTEVIIHLYEEYGTDAVRRLAGMFAFAIYDTKTRKILCARDRMGKKPLLFFKTKDDFVFGSEFSALRCHPAMPREINLQGLHDYLSLQYVPSPYTIYQQVYKLPPGHWLELNTVSGTYSIDRYWQVDYSIKSQLSPEDAAHHLRTLMFQAVSRRLMSDVPLGAFLSGGMDSSIIVGIMSRLCQQPVKTFTIGFNEAQYDEREFARNAVAAINLGANCPLEYHEQVVTARDFSLVEKLVGHYGEPFSDASMLPTYLLSQFTRQKLTVALSGDGADELFAGYERYLAMKYLAMADFIPDKLRRPVISCLRGVFHERSGERSFNGRVNRMLRVASSSADNRYLDIISRFSEELKQSIYGEQFRQFNPTATYDYLNSFQDNATAVDPVEQVMETDLHSYLPCDILTKVDIASMACSLEVRTPFLDHNVVEFAAALPLEYKQRRTSRKHILKMAFADMLPPELMNRRKRGFGVPLAQWFRGEWRHLLNERLLEGELCQRGYFKKSALQLMIKTHLESNSDLSYPLWSLLIFELFLEQDAT
jgi:asparagine synthase (glutamine-hydrolysing)